MKPFASAVLCALITIFVGNIQQSVAQDSTKVSLAFECKRNLASSKLEEVLSLVQKHYATIETMSGHFDQDSHLAALDASESSSGSVWFEKPGKMKWHYDLPEAQDFILRERTVWLYQSEINQVMIDELKEVLISDLPVAFLMGVGNLQSDFKLRGGCGTSSGAVLDLAPNSSSKKEDSLKGFKLLVDPNNVPIGARVVDAASNITAILISDLKLNVRLSDDQFETNFPPGTDKVDRRVQE